MIHPYAKRYAVCSLLNEAVVRFIQSEKPRLRWADYQYRYRMLAVAYQTATEYGQATYYEVDYPYSFHTFMAQFRPGVPYVLVKQAWDDGVANGIERAKRDTTYE